MRQAGSWIAFTCILFGLVGLCGMFGTYATGIPLERALIRSDYLDGIAAAKDPAAEIERLRPVLGSLAAPLDAAGPLPDRLAAAQAVIKSEQVRESASLNYRLRLMIAVVTVLCAALTSGIVALGFKRSP